MDETQPTCASHDLLPSFLFFFQFCLQLQITWQPNDDVLHLSYLCGGQLLVSRVANEEELVHKTGDPAADQRFDLVDAVVLPVPAH
jgi:hypothetical protein